MAHKETCFVAMNTAGRKPYFAVATLAWGQGAARDDLMRGLEHMTTWPKMRQKGWRIVKVKLTEIPRKR